MDHHNATVVPTEAMETYDGRMLVYLLNLAIVGTAMGCIVYGCASAGYQYMLRRLSPKIAPELPPPAYVVVPAEDKVIA